MATRSGDGMTELYELHAERLWRALYAFAGDADVASDAAAEAFAQCLRRGDEIRSPSRWLWQAAFRIAAGELKGRRRMSGQMPDDVATEYRDPAEDLVWVLGGLPPRQRAVLVLHYYAAYRAREIAVILGSTAATVRVQLSQGRKRLRRLLEEGHND